MSNKQVLGHKPSLKALQNYKKFHRNPSMRVHVGKTLYWWPGILALRLLYVVLPSYVCFLQDAIPRRCSLSRLQKEAEPFPQETHQQVSSQAKVCVFSYPQY